MLFALALIAVGIFSVTRPVQVETPGEDAADRPGAASNSPAGDPTAFKLTYFDPETGDPVRFNPCEPLHYVVNPSGMPSWAMPIVQEAANEIGAAAGLRIEFDGMSDEVPPRVTGRVAKGVTEVEARRIYDPDRYGERRWSPVLVAWGDLPNATGESRKFGTAGALAARGDDGRALLVTGVMILDRTANNPRGLKRVVMHEFLHILGLWHVEDSRQMMYAGTLPIGSTRLGAGDLNGLRAVGREAGCLPSVTPPAPKVELRREVGGVIR